MRNRDLRSHIAIVPQDCVLFNDTAAYNIAYGGVGIIDYAPIHDQAKATDDHIPKSGVENLAHQLHKMNQLDLKPTDFEKAQEEIIKEIIPFAKDAQIHEFLSGQKKGYLEKVGERGLKLSGGEKQRVAIARAIIKQAQIMCFDEATSSLDNETERQV